VSEYIEEFSNLARYAPDDINTDAKRKDKFLKGLNDELLVQLSVAMFLPTSHCVTRLSPWRTP
jgi:Retrotransposon gag protein.